MTGEKPRRRRMIDVDLVHEHRVSKQARETSKHAIDQMWLSHAFLELALTQNTLDTGVALLASITSRKKSRRIDMRKSES